MLCIACKNHGYDRLMKIRASAGISGIAWAIVPAALLFVLFFVLPFGVMAGLSLLSGNPVSNPDVAFTWRHYARLIDSDLYVDALIATLRIGIVTTALALVAAHGGDRPDADRHRGAHLRVDDVAGRPRRHQHHARLARLDR
jgi:hypothetical protein